MPSLSTALRATPPGTPRVDPAASAPPAIGGAPAYVHTGARLGWATLAYLACVVATITLEPFVFRRPVAPAVVWWAPDAPWHGWFDVVANVAMFAPLGFVAALARSHRGGRRLSPARAFALGAAASAAIELVQRFEPGRYASPTDVASNAVGAALGAWLCRRLAAKLRADTPLVGRLALELPITGLVYVALPLLTLAGLTAGALPAVQGTRALGLVALAAFGGTLLGTLQRRQLGPAGVRPRATAAVAGCWFAAGAVPGAATAPAVYALGAVIAAAAAWCVGRDAVPNVRAVERRFEGEAVGRAVPWLACYLALVPLGDPAGGTWDRAAVLRDLEHGAGFTVLGYLLAEAWGRREWRYRQAVWRVAFTAAAAAGVSALLAAWVGGAVVPGAGIVLRAAAATYGGWIYHLQRAHVRALVAGRTAPLRVRGRPPRESGPGAAPQWR
jgi:VanZ family protein